MLFMLVPSGEEGVFAYGDPPQPGSACAVAFRAVATPGVLKFSADHAIDILPETD